jgi:T-complex protein 1 subunit alpha
MQSLFFFFQVSRHFDNSFIHRLSHSNRFPHVQVVVENPDELEKIRQRESDITKEKIEILIKAGANVILTTKGIDDMAMKYFVENNCIAVCISVSPSFFSIFRVCCLGMCIFSTCAPMTIFVISPCSAQVRRVKKEDLRHLAKACGGQILLSLADEGGEESVDDKAFGHAAEVCEEKVGDGEVMFVKGCASTKAQTIILRGANDYMLDEIERSLHDSLSIVKRTLESMKVVPGGGAVEAALCIYLEVFRGCDGGSSGQGWGMW